MTMNVLGVGAIVFLCICFIAMGAVVTLVITDRIESAKKKELKAKND